MTTFLMGWHLSLSSYQLLTSCGSVARGDGDGLRASQRHARLECYRTLCDGVGMGPGQVHF